MTQAPIALRIFEECMIRFGYRIESRGRINVDGEGLPDGTLYEISRRATEAAPGQACWVWIWDDREHSEAAGWYAAAQVANALMPEIIPGLYDPHGLTGVSVSRAAPGSLAMDRDPVNPVDAGFAAEHREGEQP